MPSKFILLNCPVVWVTRVIIRTHCNSLSKRSLTRDLVDGLLTYTKGLVTRPFELVCRLTNLHARFGDIFELHYKCDDRLWFFSR